MRPSRARSSGAAASCHMLSSVGFITTTCESEFLVHTANNICPATRLGSSANTGCRERRNTISPTCRRTPTCAPYRPPFRRPRENALFEHVLLRWQSRRGPAALRPRHLRHGKLDPRLDEFGVVQRETDWLALVFDEKLRIEHLEPN